MDELHETDPLLSKVQAFDPEPDPVVANSFAVDRMVRNATSMPNPSIWTRGRYAATASVASLGSAAAVIALIVGLGSVGPELPVLAIGGTPKVGASGDAALAPGASTTVPSMGMMRLYRSYTFTTSPDLVVVGGGSGSHQLTASSDPATLLDHLASVFHVTGMRDATNGNYMISGTNGSYVQVWKDGGILRWDYQPESSMATDGGVAPGDVGGVASAPGDVVTTPATTETTVPPAPTAPVLSSDQAISDARAVLDQVGGFGDLGNAQVQSLDTGGDYVTFSLMVDGLATDLTTSVDYNPDGSFSASGFDAQVGGLVPYPTISATDAISQLSTTQGVSGGPIMGEPVAPMPGAVGGTADTTTTAPEQTPPALEVSINKATMGLQTYTLANGETWLLPVWLLEGPITDPSATNGDNAGDFSQTVIGVSSEYVKIAVSPIAY